MKNNLLEICDEIFQSHRLPIYVRILESNKVTFPDYPWTGLTTAVENRLDCWTIYVQDPTGGRVYTQELVLPVLPSAVEQVLRFIHDDLDTYLDQPPPCDSKPRSKPEITLKIDEYTSTEVLETLAALALWWDDIKEELYREDGEVCVTYEWKPTKHSIQALHLASKLGLQVSGKSPAEIRFNITLAAAQKYVQGA